MSKSYILSRMDWAKAYRDYEVLKVGNENLLTKGDKLQSHIVGWNNATVNQSKKDNLYHIITSGGTSVLKALINMKRDDYVQQIKDAFDGGGMVYFMFDVENNTSKEVVFALNGFRDSNNSGVRSEVVISGDYIGTVVIASASMVDGAAYQLQYWTKKVEDNIDINISPIKVSKVKGGKYTPSPKDINAQPYPAQVAHDMYQATEGNWVKAEEDYELLKVGKTNLLPEIGEQVQAGLTPLNHSENVGFYRGTITNIPTNGKSYFLDIKTPVNKGDRYTLNAQFSNSETNMYIIHFYDKDFSMISDKSLIESNIVKITNQPSVGSDIYKGFLVHSFNNTNSVAKFEIVGDDVKYMSISIGMYARPLMTQPLTVSNWKLERGDISTPFTPSPESLNASPFTVKLANDYYQQQSEITELRNAILQLGGQ